MLAHPPCNSPPGGGGMGHVAAVAHMAPTTSLIWPHVVSAEDDAVLFGYERLFVRPHPISQCLSLAHVRVERVRSPFTNYREDDCCNSRGITAFGLSNLHARS